MRECRCGRCERLEQKNKELRNNVLDEVIKELDKYKYEPLDLEVLKITIDLMKK